MAGRCAGVGLVLVLCLAAHGARSGRESLAQVTPDSAQTSDPADKATKPERRFREGTRLVDRMGHFKTTGDRLIFYSQQDDRRLAALENLALERVARVISESSDRHRWSVSGIVTEYHGQNYLLVTRAILKADGTPESSSSPELGRTDLDRRP
jgi:hypothetical protein